MARGIFKEFGSTAGVCLRLELPFSLVFCALLQADGNDVQPFLYVHVRGVTYVCVHLRCSTTKNWRLCTLMPRLCVVCVVLVAPCLWHISGVFTPVPVSQIMFTEPVAFSVSECCVVPQVDGNDARPYLYVHVLQRCKQLCTTLVTTSSA